MSGITHRKMPCAIPPRPGRPGQSLFAIGPFGFTREERVNGVGSRRTQDENATVRYRASLYRVSSDGGPSEITRVRSTNSTNCA
jgi:hypothetical protein